jgi:SSS family solute:Na+ symporter
MTGLVSPGLFAAFFMGFFWKKTNSEGALFAIVGGFIMSLWMYKYMTEVPFIDKMGYVFLICVSVMVALGLWKPSDKGLEVNSDDFKISGNFAIGTGVILTTLAILYYTFW